MKTCPKCGYKTPEKPRLECGHCGSHPTIEISKEVAEFMSIHHLDLVLHLPDEDEVHYTSGR